MIESNKYNAVAFYDPSGFVPAFKHASQFAGKEGGIATLPQIVEARLAAPDTDPSWSKYFTTLSAEYVGMSKKGHPIAIVAHGNGPLSTLEGIQKAYSYEYKDTHRNHTGGRISQEDFLKLEAGDYGPVSVVPLKTVWSRREYAFSGHAITTKEIEEETLWQARLGARWREFIARHVEVSQAWEKGREETYGPKWPRKFPRPCILVMDSANNTNYNDRDGFDFHLREAPGTAIAHLLSIGQLTGSGHQYHETYYEDRESRDSLVSDIGCHEWSNGVRLVGYRPGSPMRIHRGLPDMRALLRTQQDKLWVPNPKGGSRDTNGFWSLLERDDWFFTSYPKKGEGMDTGEPEFKVASIEKLETKTFDTDVKGYYGFVKYGIREVKAIAPLEANAYILGEMKLYDDANRQRGPITFYKVSVDRSRRLVRHGDIYRNYDLMMSLLD